MTLVVTPVRPQVLNKLLNQAGYPHDKTQFLVQGFSQGFNIQYQGPCHRTSTSDNLRLTAGSKTQLWNKIIKEVKLGRVAGPFDRIPYDTFIQSPVGLVPKVGSDQTRLIFHLSYDFKGQEVEGSLNHFTSNWVIWSNQRQKQFIQAKLTSKVHFAYLDYHQIAGNG